MDKTGVTCTSHPDPWVTGCLAGGMGSLGGAAVGAVLLAIVDSYSDVYLIFGSHNWTNYSILLTFLLLVFVLAVRPLGLFGRPA